jgi:hypothetical protein
VSALREIFARFGVSFDNRALEAGDRSVQGMTSSLQDLGNLLIGGAAAVGLRSFIQTSEEAANELDRYSRILGVTTRDLQAWGVAAQSVGQDLDGVVDAMSTLQERARDAVQDPKSDPALQLRSLGVAARDANGDLKDGQTLLLEVAAGMQGLGTQTDRVGAAMTLFGDVGRELLPVLQDVGEHGFDPLLERLDAAGGGLSEDFVRAGVEASRASARLDVGLQSLRSRIGVVLLPVVTRLTDGLTDLLGRFVTMTGQSRIMEAAMVTLGTAAAGAALKMILPFAPAILTFAAVALVIAGVTLVVEDLLVALDGGKSVFGDFTNAMEDFFEMNREQEGIVADLAREWEGYVRTVERAIAVLGEWLGLGPSVDELYGEQTTTNRGLQSPEEARAAMAGREERSSAFSFDGIRRALYGDETAEEAPGFLNDPMGDAFRRSRAQRSVRASETEGTGFTSVRGLQPPPSVSQNVEITVNGATDARAVATEVRRELDRHLRETADAFSNGGEEL